MVWITRSFSASNYDSLKGEELFTSLPRGKCFHGLGMTFVWWLVTSTVIIGLTPTGAVNKGFGPEAETSQATGANRLRGRIIWLRIIKTMCRGRPPLLPQLTYEGEARMFIIEVTNKKTGCTHLKWNWKMLFWVISSRFIPYFLIFYTLHEVKFAINLKQAKKFIHRFCHIFHGYSNKNLHFPHFNIAQVHLQ